jgi:hypothetical protein
MAETPVERFATPRSIKEALLDILATDPEVQAQLRAVLLDGQTLIDVRTHDTPDAPGRPVIAVAVPTGTSPSAIAAAIDAVVTPTPTSTAPKRHVPPWIARRQPGG